VIASADARRVWGPSQGPHFYNRIGMTTQT
jgi:hypothetical protein